MDDSKQNPSQSQSDDSGSLTFTVQQRLFFVVLVATMGALAFGYDTGIISGALPYMTLPAAQGAASPAAASRRAVSISRHLPKGW